MGMKSGLSKILPFMMLGAMLDQDTYERVEKKEAEPQPKKEPTPFNKQDGIVRMISDYKLIKSGQSKKGKVKQSRIVRKIEAYLKSGQLSEEDLK